MNLHSLGGATEGTIWSITYNVMKNEVNQLKYIPYGYPLTNQTIYILNNEHDFCDVGSWRNCYWWNGSSPWVYK